MCDLLGKNCIDNTGEKDSKKNIKLPFDETTIQELKEIFLFLDKTNSCNLKVCQALDILRILGQNPSIRDFKRLCDQGGIKPDDSLEFEPMVLFLSLYKFETGEEVYANLEKAFKVFDYYDNEAISCSELKNWLTKSEEPLEPRQAELFLRLGRDNRNINRFNYKEFIKEVKLGKI